MYDAVLEVNHWCHEKANYQPSDARTSSPLATVKTAYGRCGEESTFLVAALRSVGIPARQVYTPRWAHTDDNHAPGGLRARTCLEPGLVQRAGKPGDADAYQGVRAL